MDGGVTPPTWGPPPPCKQALRNTMLFYFCLVAIGYCRNKLRYAS